MEESQSELTDTEDAADDGVAARSSAPFPVLAIGASAGGLTSLDQQLRRFGSTQR